MREQLAVILHKSLLANGVQLTGKELNPVVNDLMAFLEPKKDTPLVAGTELKPIPPTGAKS